MAKQKRPCSIDNRVKDQYISTMPKGLAQVMYEIHQFRVSKGHAPPNFD